MDGQKKSEFSCSMSKNITKRIGGISDDGIHDDGNMLLFIIINIESIPSNNVFTTYSILLVSVHVYKNKCFQYLEALSMHAIVSG